eukprot:CAMPEP_0194075886 /NCGR_PEP_ID=MMETSP0149-20130528/2787_1 /TAXON_ID=122233 /ORGANISM="Chaetoceros debilis, Strain MM31A-1" /LENGTH=759 /DNA_ID=CAMNT_0038756483 /DNA_START=415 /DNA_END=2694 /DNA_ORIENTATION=+
MQRPQDLSDSHTNNGFIDTFRELIIGYKRTYRTEDEYGTLTGETQTEWVVMDKPRICCYQKTSITGRVVSDKVRLGASLATGTIDFDQSLLLLENSEQGISRDASDKSVGKFNLMRKDQKFGSGKKSIRLGRRSNSAICTIPRAEERGITLRQLRAVYANAERRCEEEKWVGLKGELLKPHTVTLYDVCEYIIKPFTKESKKSFIEELRSTAGSQPPRFFASHWWGEPIKDFVVCLEQHRRDFAMNVNEEQERKGGGMTEDTPIWVCAYANNQWDLDDYVTKDPAKSAFMDAMKMANYRTISILDKHGIVFNRVWCIYELYRTFINKIDTGMGLWCIYTAHRHIPQNLKIYNLQPGEIPEGREAVGIVPGGATSDYSSSYTSERERYFPFHLIKRSLLTKVELAEASYESDRRHILNSIIGNKDIDMNPPENHFLFSALNMSLHSHFAVSPRALQGALFNGDKQWKAMLRTMSKGTLKDNLDFNFREGGRWDQLTKDQAVDLISHLPLTIESLTINTAPYGSIFMIALIKWLKKCQNIKVLKIYFTCVGTLAGTDLAKAIATNKTIEELVLYETDLVGERNAFQWAHALSLNRTLKIFQVRGMAGYQADPIPERHAYAHLYHLDDRQTLYCQNGIFIDSVLGNNGLQTIGRGIIENDSLELIDLRNHNIGKEGIRSLAPMITQTKSWKKWICTRKTHMRPLQPNQNNKRNMAQINLHESNNNELNSEISSALEELQSLVSNQSKPKFALTSMRYPTTSA